jgi:hypothetical protein
MRTPFCEEVRFSSDLAVALHAQAPTTEQHQRGHGVDTKAVTVAAYYTHVFTRAYNHSLDLTGAWQCSVSGYSKGLCILILHRDRTDSSHSVKWFTVCSCTLRSANTTLSSAVE